MMVFFAPLPFRKIDHVLIVYNFFFFLKYNLNICSLFIYLKVHKKLYALILFFFQQVAYIYIYM